MYSKFLLLNIDEFQNSVEISKKLISACLCTIIHHDFSLHVVPIVSGIMYLNSVLKTIQWPQFSVHLGKLPEANLWAAYLNALGLPLLPPLHLNHQGSTHLLPR